MAGTYELSPEDEYSVELDELMLVLARHYSEFRAQLLSCPRVAISLRGRNARLFRIAAAKCRDLDLDPSGFVRERLETALNTHGKIFPQCLISDVEAPVSTSHRHVDLYRSLLELWEARVRLFGPQVTLADKTNPFTPLFKYAMAKLHGLDFSTYAADARVELAARPESAEVFGDLIGELKHV